PGLRCSSARQYSCAMLATQAELEAALLPTALRLGGGRAGLVRTLTGDASNRRYHRVTLTAGRPASLVVMELGDRPMGSEEASKAELPTELPFINIQRYLARGGVAVPELYHYDQAAGLLYLEDLGDLTLEKVVRDGSADTRWGYYCTAISDLIA